MTSIKCPNCNLTNWATAISCKRCKQMLQNGGESFQPNEPTAESFDGQNFAPDASPHFQPDNDWQPPVDNQTQTHWQPPYTPNYQQNYYPSPPLKSGLAIASMVLGILGFVTAIFLVGIVIAPIGLILGIVALVKANKKPHIYGGKGFAITGIVTGGMMVLVMPIIAAIAIPNLLAARRAANEGAAISTMRTIVSAESTYVQTAGRGRCGDLNTLSAANLIDPTLAKGEKSGYRFIVVNLPIADGGCEVRATPISASNGTRSFYFSTEDGIFRAAAKGGQPANGNDAAMR